MEPTQTYLDRINAIGLNIVVCARCNTIVIVESGPTVDEHTCRFCGFTDDISSFPDYFDPDYDHKGLGEAELEVLDGLT